MLNELMDYSLIQCEGNRIYVHPLLKEYTNGQLDISAVIPDYEENEQYMIKEKIREYELAILMYKESGDTELEAKYNKLLETLKADYSTLKAVE